MTFSCFGLVGDITQGDICHGPGNEVWMLQNACRFLMHLCMRRRAACLRVVYTLLLKKARNCSYQGLVIIAPRFLHTAGYSLPWLVESL
jgi:hypothetical protein